MSFFSIIMFVVVLLAGGRGINKGLPNDLLDLVPTDSYWQVKNVVPSTDQLLRDAAPDPPPQNVNALLTALQSPDFPARDKARQELERMGPAILPQLQPATESKDPEVAAVAAELIKRFTESAQERPIRRLMAIRTLGERREKSALPALKPLLDSQELFVSDYALRAIAAIEGHTLEPVDQTLNFQKDFDLLPSHLSIAGQLRGTGQHGNNDLVQIFAEAATRPGIMPVPAQQNQDKGQILQAITRRALRVLERVGNLRIDGMTFAVSDDVGNTSGWGLLIIRGKYDATLVKAALDSLDPAAATQTAAAVKKRGDDVPRFDLGPDDPILLLPSNDRLVFILGDKEADRTRLLDAIIPALKSGKGAFDAAAPIAALLQKVDRNSPAWAVAVLNNDMKSAKFLEGFNTVTFQAAPAKDAFSFTFNGAGDDPEKVKGSVSELAQNIQVAQQTLQQQAVNGPDARMVQPVLDFMMTLKAAPQGANATLTGEMNLHIIDTIIAEIAPLVVTELLPPPSEGWGQDNGAPRAR